MIRTNTLLYNSFLVLFLGFTLYMLYSGGTILSIIEVPAAILQMNTIFISILIEALPFVLIGVFIAGIIQIFVTESHIKRCLPKNRYLAIVSSCFIGACFPACECGIVPIVRRLLGKGVPIYAGIGFMLTGPLINPMVILSTYMAFGNNLNMAISRMIIGFVLALMIAFIVSCFFRSNHLKIPAHFGQEHHDGHGHHSLMYKLKDTVMHAIDEFFDIGKFLIVGALLAAFVQTFLSAEVLIDLGGGTASSTAVMMALAYLLSLCSEADAFIGVSFQHLFPPAAILSFLIYGPMLDLKNTMMMLSVFKARFVFVLLIVITVVVYGGMIIIQTLA
nr:permease [Paraliobacillus ryukyuensis]